MGPISPESVEGYRQFIAFRDTRSKYLFCYPVKTCNEDIFLHYLNRVLRFFTTRGFKPRILRSDYYTTFRSAKANQFYEDNQCRHESSAPYQQWQNAVERDIQTIISNVSATIHGQDFLRADIWAHALTHWTRLHNAVPHAVLQDTPARIIDPIFCVDAHHQYRFVFGDLLCFPLQDHERLWKFDVKNDIGFYAGDEDSVKGGSVIYMPYTHSFLTRGNGHRILISDLQLLQWYSQRRDIRRNPLPYSVVHNAVMDLLSNRETPAEKADSSQILITPALTDQGDLTIPSAPAIVQHVLPSPPLAPPTRTNSRPRTALLPIPPPAAIRRDDRVRTKTAFYKPHDIRAVTAAIREIMDRDNPPTPIFPTTDNDHLPSDIDMMRSYAIDTLFDSAYYTGDTEEIETAEALHAPDRDQFIAAIKKEVHSLISETRTLQPLTKTGSGYAENIGNKRVWKIRTTLKCKRKKKSNGEPDKHKARAAARGDTLRRAMIKAQVPLPDNYSPTIMPLTFSLFLQLAVIQKLHMATMDIKSAYLNAALPPEADWIVTTLEPHIAAVCGLDPAQEYRIANALYGLPDSGRLFYQHYKAALLAEEYTMSAFDNCLFYKTTATETTYIIVYVDDTFIFSNSAANIDAVSKHYEVTLDRDANSFLGLNLMHNPDGTVTITQPKLLLKLFSLYPPRKDSPPAPKHPYPPLPKETDPPPQPADHFTYLRLLGILLYLTKSRPDIMAAVSFAGTKSSKPTDRDLSDLYYVVEYLRATQELGHILHTSTQAALRLYCEVDASYLLHPDSKGHTGYTISFYGTLGTFHNRSVKQTAVATSSTHAETRAIFTLAKELNFLIALCQELQIPLELPAIIMEDNSAVVTMANNDSGYTKKCKHFLMVLNYIKEQIALGQIEARKIYGKLNNADMHTKPLRSSDFAHMAHKILGQPAAIPPSAHTTSTLPVANMSAMNDMDAGSQPSNERKRSWLPTETNALAGVKRRKEHLSRFLTRPASDSTMDADVNVPALQL